MHRRALNISYINNFSLSIWCDVLCHEANHYLKWLYLTMLASSQVNCTRGLLFPECLVIYTESHTTKCCEMCL